MSVIINYATKETPITSVVMEGAHCGGVSLEAMWPNKGHNDKCFDHILIRGYHYSREDIIEFGEALIKMARAGR